jgi:hypothetical protein
MGPVGGPPPLRPPPFGPLTAPVMDWQPLPVGRPITVIPDADPIMSLECLRKMLEAYLEEHYYAAASGVMGIDSNTPPQPKPDYCSNFGLVMATWEIQNGKSQAAEPEGFKQRIAEFKAWCPFQATPINDVTE